MKSQVTHEEAEKRLQANLDRLAELAESVSQASTKLNKFVLKEFLEKEFIVVEEDPYKSEKTSEIEGLNAGRNQ